jgi:UDP-N-acetylmuramyl pentapeptide phosphotransferase/UDP-N-acetylglucosamine-1-phosphate transferase
MASECWRGRSRTSPGLETSAPELLVVAGFLASFGLGLYDDRKGMSAKLKLGAQALCAVLLVSGCYAAGWMRGGFFFPLAVVWVVAIMNATNFLDNMDGVAGGDRPRRWRLCLSSLTALGRCDPGTSLLGASLIS